MKHSVRLALLLIVAMGAGAASSRGASLATAIEVVRAVGPEGRGNASASAAWRQLSSAKATALPVILGGMDGANDLALNWLRAAVDAIASRELAAGRSLPVKELERFLRDLRHHPRARRLAYELIQRANPNATASLLGGMMDDPSAELRRDAVQRAIEEASSQRRHGRTNEAASRLRTALRSARDVDQIEDISRHLKELGAPVQLRSVFGWLSRWKVVGPFDNAGGVGFENVYPPETKIDLQAEYEGPSAKIRWQDLKADGDYGLVDFNKPFGALKGVAGYAYTEFQSPRAGPVELRLGCKNGWKIWVNGEFLFGRDEYHRGVEIDQYRLKTQLKAGRNTILVKLCQNELKEDWTKEWEFQLRITDALGTPVASANSNQ